MLCPIEELKFAELRDKCRELHVPSPPEILIGLQVHDHNGVLTFEDIQRAHSWTRNFYNKLYMTITGVLGTASALGAGNIGMTDAGGNNSYTYSFNDLNAVRPAVYYGAVAETAGGIVVGSGDTAFGANQYALATLIANGTGSGQLSYGAQTIGTPSYTAGSKTWTYSFVRILNNNSAGSITVKEAGIYFKGTIWTYSYMMERTVLSPTVAVAVGARLTVTYAISMDFSAID